MLLSHFEYYLTSLIQHAEIQPHPDIRKDFLQRQSKSPGRMHLPECLKRNKITLQRRVHVCVYV